MNFVEGLITLISAIPALRKFFEAVMVEYAKLQREQMMQENREALEALFAKKDQRPVEDLLGSPKAGKPSGLEGTEIVDGLPDMPRL
jgi:hypothetical protein